VGYSLHGSTVREGRKGGQSPRWEGAASNNMAGSESLDALEERLELPVGCFQKATKPTCSRVIQWLNEEASTNVAPKTFGRAERHCMHRLDLTKEHVVLDPESWFRAQPWDEISPRTTCT